MKKEIIKFYSTEDNFIKEQSGQKPNTVRKVDMDDERFNILHAWVGYNNFDLWVVITNSCNKTEYFARQVKDVTFFDGYVIISWRD